MCSIRAVSIVQSAVSIESQMPDEQYPCSIRVQYPEVSTLFVSSIRAVSCSILQYPAVSCPSMCEQYPCVTYPQPTSVGPTRRILEQSDCLLPGSRGESHLSNQVPWLGRGHIPWVTRHAGCFKWGLDCYDRTPNQARLWGWSLHLWSRWTLATQYLNASGLRQINQFL